MGSFSGDEAANDHSALATYLVDSDRALLLASVAFSGQGRQPESDETAVDLLAGFRERLAPAWLQTLGRALDGEASLPEWSDRGQAIDRLRRMHHATAGVDLRRVHPSWLLRALREESPAVQRLVAASLPDSLRHQMQAGLLLDSQDLKSERPAAPEVASWVMALWTERLVGGDAKQSLDSPGVTVLVQLCPRSGYRLCWMVGFCKLILAGRPPARFGDAKHRARDEWLARRLVEADAGLRELARRDVENSRSSKLPLRHQPARIGLATIARLLVDTEPFRLRWALQHWPYPIAKLIRSLLPPSTSRPPSLLQSESWILKTAWDRLELEGRLLTSWPGSGSLMPSGAVPTRAQQAVRNLRSSTGNERGLAGALESRGRPVVSHLTSLIERDSRDGLGPATPAGDAGPLGWLPRLSYRQVSLERHLDRWAGNGSLPPRLGWLQNEMGIAVAIDRPEIRWRASGLGRAGLVTQLTVPRLATRLAIGIETPLAHAVVDRLLGFDRPFAGRRSQLTPVEWGVWTFLIVCAITSFDPERRPDSLQRPDIAANLGPGDLTLDRVGPDSFDPSGLGGIVTVRWPVRIGDVAGAIRLWLPEFVISLWAAGPKPPIAAETIAAPCPDESDPASESSRRALRGDLVSCWRAEAGLVTMSQGLKRLRAGGVLPLSSSALTGTPASPVGAVALILNLDGQEARFRIPVCPVADSGGRLARIEAGPLLEPRPRDPIDATISENKPMSQPTASSTTAPGAGPLDVPVTLTVELGRVNLTLTQLADLKPGDVVELNRHSRGPVELTSNGRLVARGELILIDTDLGVRVTNVFL